MPQRRILRTVRRIGALLRPHATGEADPLLAGALLGVAVVGLRVVQPWPLLHHGRAAFAGTREAYVDWYARRTGRDVAMASAES